MNPQAPRSLRPVDLARLAGVSSQQIRNYEEAAILPPAERSPAGYRRYDAGHRRALLTYRALTRGFGWATARAVMQAIHRGDAAQALAIVDASHAAVHDERRSLEEARVALEALAVDDPGDSAVPKAGLRIGEVAALLGVRTSALRVWESAGLLDPPRERGTRYRRYGETDLRDARLILMLRQGRYRLPQIRTILDGLRRTGSRDALHAAIAQRHKELTARSGAMLEASGPLHDYLTLRFQAD